ncbi:MAG TPA: MarR family transcriptional regulator [Solirubrobacteraceae bacterium]
MQATTTNASARDLGAQLLAVMHRAMREAGSDVVSLFEELELSLTHVKLLNILDSGGEMNVKALSEVTGLSLPGASRAADALIRRGLVERREDPQDRRSKLLTITSAGREATGRITQARLAGFERFAASLTPEQRAALGAALAPLLETT